jgi:hypothetical protein
MWKGCHKKEKLQEFINGSQLVSRPIGRPKNRWEDDVRKDLQTAMIKNWKKRVLDRDSWKTIVERIKPHIEL